jgi:hypothetical protein
MPETQLIFSGLPRRFAPRNDEVGAFYKNYKPRHFEEQSDEAIQKLNLLCI